VATDPQPAELAALIAFAERPRIGDWSLRAALTRYAQPQPQRVSDVLDLVRRIEFAMGAHQAAVADDGPALWRALESDDAASSSNQIVGLLRAIVELDQLGDVLAAWAAAPTTERPDAAVDAAIADVARRLDDLGVAREERQPPSRRRG
jgi:hypothetical protein